MVKSLKNNFHSLSITILAVLLGFQVSWAADPPEGPLDCEVYETKKSGITIGFRVGNLLLNAGPDVTFTQEQGIAWDRVSQSLIARYVELCTRYNAGLVTKEEYQARIQEVEILHREAQELEDRLIQQVRHNKESAMKRMDRLFSKKSGQEQGKTENAKQSEKDPLVVEAHTLSNRIEGLLPLGRPLQPTKPCPPPDMLGTPGAKTDTKEKCDRN